MGKELSRIRNRETIMKFNLEVENTWLRNPLQEEEGQLETMEILSMEALQCRMPTKSYVLYLKEEWL